MILSHAHLLDILYYASETGAWYWQVSLGTQRKGAKAGCIDEHYWRICIGKKNYRAARLAFFYITGRWPHKIDHIDGNTLNDRWNNLREATNSHNAANSSLHSDSLSGYKGVSLHRGKYRARIRVAGQEIHLGIYNSAKEAHHSYCLAAVRHFGEFARVR